MRCAGKITVKSKFANVPFLTFGLKVSYLSIIHTIFISPHDHTQPVYHNLQLHIHHQNEIYNYPYPHPHHQNLLTEISFQFFS